MKLSIKILPAVLLLFVGLPVFAQQRLSLDSVLQVIRRQHPLLQQFERRVSALDAYAEGADAWMPPMAGAGTFMTPYPFQEDIMPDNKGSLMLAVEQQIPNPAKTGAKEKWLGSKAAVEEARALAAYNELRAAAKKAYYQWAVLEKKQAVLLEMQRIMITMKKLAKIRYPYGQGTLGNIYEAEGRLYEVENMLLMIAGEKEQKNILLNKLMDIPPTVDYLIDTGVITTLPARLVPVVDTLELAEVRSDILALETGIESMRLNQELARTEAKPDFGLRFEHMSSYSGMMPQQFTLMGMVSIPVAPWSSRGYKAEVKGMGFEIQAMEKEREVMLNEAVAELAAMHIELEVLAQQLQNYQQKIIPALEKNFEVVMLAYEENNGELPMVIDAWEDLSSTRLDYLDRLESYYVTLAAYEKELER
ncbi:TolC family protein [Nafulsella turpanensis]|uniref:TolC family protein n=1 Tax=Nafulsella turpanensis TaxID=1265690 RepID=UPI000346F459|nr:TolC family protein [Nafulsella turpanensis]